MIKNKDNWIRIHGKWRHNAKKAKRGAAEDKEGWKKANEKNEKTASERYRNSNVQCKIWKHRQSKR